MPDRNSAALWWTDFKIALGLLTRAPVGHAQAPAPADYARAARLSPLVGALIGLAGGVAFWVATELSLPIPACALLAVAATALITGALGEDGLAGVAEGFAGGAEASRKLEIMGESRIGTYGTLTVVLSVGLRVAALSALAAPAAAMAALIAAHAIARAALPAVSYTLPVARAEGLASGAQQPEAGHVWVAVGLALAIALIALGLGAGLVAGLAAIAAVAVVAVAARDQVGGYTREVLGAAEQFAEIAVLLAAAALL